MSSKALVHRNWSLCRNTIVDVAPEEADVFPGRILAFVNMVTVSWSINVSLLQISPLLSEEQWRAHSQSLLSTAWHLKMYAKSAFRTYSRGRVDTKRAAYFWKNVYFFFDYNVFSMVKWHVARRHYTQLALLMLIVKKTKQILTGI